MPPVVPVGKHEWESFLAGHSRLGQKYHLLLTRRHIVRRKIEGIRDKTGKQMAKSRET
jgi:hypothetical protein